MKVSTSRPLLRVWARDGNETIAAVFAHPFLADAAETLFLPVVESSVDRQPAPTLLISNGAAADLCPPLDHLTVATVAGSMVVALRAASHYVPPYLQLLADESASAGRTQRATFAMGCFWKGEGTIGGIRGVVATKPGLLNGLEVVDAEFDPSVVSYDELLKTSRAAGAADRAIPRSDAQRRAGGTEPRCDAAIAADEVPKFYLSRTTFRHVPMTSAQASRVNAALANHADPNSWLSPRQLRLHQVVIAHPERPWHNSIAADFTTAWRDAARLARLEY